MSNSPIKLNDVLDPRWPNISGEPTEQDARHEAEEERRMRAEQANARAERQLTFFRQVGKRHSQCTLENYQTECDGQSHAVILLREYLDRAPARVRAGEGIVLFGPSGTGKDHLLVGVGRELINRHDLEVAWHHGLDIHGRFRDAIKSDSLERLLVNEFVTPRVLIISDPLPPRGALSEYQASTLLRILDLRYRHCRPTLVSMNVANAEEADARLGAAAVDRLRDGAVTAYCNWPTYRVSRDESGRAAKYSS